KLSKQTVRRGFLRALGGAKLDEGSKGSGRLELANWLVSNPLAPRVIVNRIWQHHFGVGLVATPSDFGARGTPPTHPELLDYLAGEFVAQGWSIKRLHREILLSRSYRASSETVASSESIDPDNRFLWRATRRRLDAEQIRDSILSFAGELDLSVGGRHPFPHRLTYFYRQHEPFQEEYTTRRRSVYMMQQRLKKNEFLDLFDGPDGNLHVGTRRESTTTLQALYFMNSEFMHRRSEAIACRVLSRSKKDAQRIQIAYRTVLQRMPRAEERLRVQGYLSSMRALKGTDSDLRIWAAFLRSLLASNEFLFLD
ncbi:MAG: DUF1553 domain-containing protein, partial [Planctomycetota bacterium]